MSERAHRLTFVYVCLLPIVASLPARRASARVFSGAVSGTLGRQPQLRPGALGGGGRDGMQNADPPEGSALVEPPEVNEQARRVGRARRGGRRGTRRARPAGTVTLL